MSEAQPNWADSYAAQGALGRTTVGGRLGSCLEGRASVAVHLEGGRGGRLRGMELWGAAKSARHLLLKTPPAILGSPFGLSGVGDQFPGRPEAVVIVPPTASVWIFSLAILG